LRKISKRFKKKSQHRQKSGNVEQKYRSVAKNTPTFQEKGSTLPKIPQRFKLEVRFCQKTRNTGIKTPPLPEIPHRCRKYSGNVREMECLGVVIG
jgi:hypothetical protein